jgi:stress response protein YsnF
VVEEVVVGKEVDERTERVDDKVRRTDVEIDRLARQADGALGRATGDAHDEEDQLARTPNTTPRTGERGRAQTPSETRRKT